MVIALGRAYVGSDFNGIPEMVTEAITTNERVTTRTHDVTSARQIITSAEDRVITSTYDPATYEFDPDDRLSKVTEGSDITDYVYSSTGELVSVTLPDGTRIDYVHDPLGRRIAKKINGTIVEKHLWSGQTTLRCP